MDDNIKNLAPHEKSKIKELLCEISDQLNQLCEMLPPSKIKSAICSIGWIMSLICSAIPD